MQKKGIGFVVKIAINFFLLSCLKKLGEVDITILNLRCKVAEISKRGPAMIYPKPLQ